jgi:hypothetical protein
MKIYSKSKRDIIIARSDCIDKDLPEPKDKLSKKYFHIKPEMITEIQDDVAAKLMLMYPGEIVQWGDQKKAG